MSDLVYFYYGIVIIVGTLLLRAVYRRIHVEQVEESKIDFLESREIMKTISQNCSSPSDPKKSIAGYKTNEIQTIIAENYSNNLGNFDKGGYIGTGPKPSKPQH